MPESIVEISLCLFSEIVVFFFVEFLFLFLLLLFFFGLETVTDRIIFFEKYRVGPCESGVGLSDAVLVAGVGLRVGLSSQNGLLAYVFGFVATLLENLCA